MKFPTRLTLIEKYQHLSEIMEGWGFTWGGLKDNRKGEWWLMAQILLIGAHLLLIQVIFEQSWNITPILIIGRISAIFLFLDGNIKVIKAFLSLGKSLSPLPEPKAGAKLITERSYKYCRHPLYRGLIIISASLTLYTFSKVYLILLISLSLILIIKAKKEEAKLKIVYSNYTNYQKCTPAIFRKIIFYDWRE